MSRLAKLQNPLILTKLPPKPCFQGSYYDLEEMIESPKTKKKDEHVEKTTAAGSKKSEKNEGSGSRIQQGAIEAIKKLFLNLGSEQESCKCTRKRLSSSPCEGFSNKNEKNTFESFFNMNRRSKKFRGSRHIQLSKQRQITRFDPLRSPYSESLKPENLLERIFILCEIDDEVFILTLIYLDKAIKNHKLIGRQHFQKLFTACFLLAHKFLNEDFFWVFEDLSIVTGVSPNLIGEIEVFVLDKIFGHKLLVSTEEFERAKDDLIEGCF